MAAQELLVQRFRTGLIPVEPRALQFFDAGIRIGIAHGIGVGWAEYLLRRCAPTPCFNFLDLFRAVELLQKPGRNAVGKIAPDSFGVTPD